MRLRLLVGLALLALAPAANAYVYWGEGTTEGGVGRAELDGGNVENDFVPARPGGNSFVRGAAVSPTKLFWGQSGGTAVIGASNLDGTLPNYAFTSASSGGMTGLGTDATHIYWTSGAQDFGNVGRTPIAGGQGVQTISNNFGEPRRQPCGVAASATHVYWANAETRTIGRANLDLSAPDWNFIVLPPGPLQPCGIAVDSTKVYFGLGSGIGFGGTTGGIMSADHDGTNVGGVVFDAGPVTGLAIEDGILYWSQQNTGAIGRSLTSGNGVSKNFISGLTAPFGVAVDAGGPAAPPPPDVPPPPPPPLGAVAIGSGGGGGGGGSATGVVFSSPPSTSNKSFAPGGKNTPVSGKTAKSAPRGTVFSFSLAAPATVKIEIKRAGKRKPVATLTRRARAGKNKVPFTGRIRGKALKPGRYKAVFTAASGGKTSKALSVAFRVVRP